MAARYALVSSAAALALLFEAACGSASTTNAVPQTPSARNLQPVDPATLAGYRRGRTYVPVYSSIYWGAERGGGAEAVVDLTITLSARNTSATAPVAIESVRYYDSAGKLLRDYLSRPSMLRPMASVEFVVKRLDRAGGPGANFLVDWSVPEGADEPLFEAVMVGQHGSAGLSFTSAGRPVKR